MKIMHPRQDKVSKKPQASSTSIEQRGKNHSVLTRAKLLMWSSIPMQICSQKSLYQLKMMENIIIYTMYLIVKPIINFW